MTMQIGGIDANQIVTDLMALERRPLVALEQRQEAAEVASRALRGIRTNVDAFRFASLKLAGNGAFSRFSASSSNSSAVTASASENAAASSLSFTVAQLATNHGLRSVGTVATADTQITTAATISLAAGGQPLGIDTVRATSGLSAGEQNLTITQASSAATRQSAAAISGATLAASEFVDVEIDGVAASIELTAGTYTAEQFATALDTGLSNAGLAASAQLDSAGRVVVTTDDEGSAATIQFTGGSGLARGGMTVDATAVTGADAIVTSGAASTTLTRLSAGSTVTVSTDDGDLELDLNGGLRAGTLSVDTIDVGGGTLAEVASAINSSNGASSAAAVRVGDGAWRLQLTSRTSGDDGELMIDGDVFSSLGGLVESSAAQNAEIVIGSGPGAYTVESSSNTFTDVLAGTSLTVSETTTDPVTVSVERNDSALADDVAQLVATANTALAEIKVQTRYGVDGIGNGALAGDGTVRRIADQIRSALGRPVDGFGDLIGADVGIQTTRDGSFTFDEATFRAALAEDPEAVARFFGRSATSPAGVTFVDAAPETVTGSYDIEVTTAATQATSARIFDGGAGSTVRAGVRVGDTTATVDISAGQSASEIIDAFNAAFAANDLALTAEVDAGGLVVRSNDWGANGSFELNLDVDGVGTWDDVTGTDVVGTIDGVLASGIGRTLSLNELVDSPAAGLSVEIDGGVSGVLGSVEYQPGVAARVAEITTQLVGEDGAFDSAEDAQQRRIDDFNDQIDRFEDRLFTRETSLRRQWANLQTLLEGLQQQGAWLAGQISSLPQVNQG